jgi:ABC-type multidrug transport system ATPase subunit
VNATFARDDTVLVAPFSIELDAGERRTLTFADARAASIGARMAAGIVKPTSGKLLICDFDPRIQPVQAKRLAGYVPYNGDFGWDPVRAGGRPDEIDLRAALFEVPRADARRRVKATLEALGASGDFAFAVALALIRDVALLVLDRPPPALEARVAEIVAAKVAVLSTL